MSEKTLAFRNKCPNFARKKYDIIHSENTIILLFLIIMRFVSKFCKGLLMVVACAFVTACSLKKEHTQETPLVRLVEAETSVSGGMSSFPGKTYPSDVSNVAFRVSGTIESVLVKEGDHVRRGQVIARMDSRDYQVQLDATRAEYESVKAECERIIALYNDNGTSQNNYDKARYGLQQITQKLRHAEDQLADCVVTAPFDGYVQGVLHKSHETVAAGMPVVNLFASNGIELRINIPANEYQRAKEFDHFTASFAAIPEKDYDLRLLSVAQKANANQLYEVRLLLVDESKSVTPGMTAMVTVFYDVKNLPVLTKIPSSAIFESRGHSCIFVYNQTDSTIHQREIILNSLTNDGLCLVHVRLADNERVVECGVHHLSDGDKVRPNPVPSSTNVGGLL